MLVFLSSFGAGRCIFHACAFWMNFLGKVVILLIKFSFIVLSKEIAKKSLTCTVFSMFDVVLAPALIIFKDIYYRNQAGFCSF